MIRTNKVEDTLDNINIDKTLIPFGRIVYGVDLMFMFQFTDGNFDEEIIYWSDFLKRQTNILPYKEDLLDSITTKFDKVGHSLSTEQIQGIVKNMRKVKNKKVITETFKDKTSKEKLEASEKQDKETFLDEDKLLKTKE